MTLDRTARAVNILMALLAALLAFTLLGVGLDVDRLNAAYVYTLCGLIITTYLAYVIIAVALFLRGEQR